MEKVHKRRLVVIGIILGSILVIFTFGKLIVYAYFLVDVRSGMLNYLENKYDQEFECLSFSGHDWFAQPADMMVAYPKGTNPDETQFKVIKIHKYGTGKNYASDAYFGVLIRPEYEKFASEIASKYFDEFKLYAEFDTNRMSDELDSNSTFEDMLNISDPDERIFNSSSIFIFIPEWSKEEKELEDKLLLLTKELQNKKITGSISILYFTKGGYENVTRTFWREEGFNNRDKLGIGWVRLSIDKNFEIY